MQINSQKKGRRPVNQYYNYKKYKLSQKDSPQVNLEQMQETISMSLEKSSNHTERVVLCHIAGPSGCGKSTLMQNLRSKFPQIEFKDLDDFDDDALKQMPSKLKGLPKEAWSPKLFDTMFDKKQALLNKFLATGRRPVVLVGIHNEGYRKLNFFTLNKFLMNIDAEGAAVRAVNRAKQNNTTHSNHSNMVGAEGSVGPAIWERRAQAQKDILWLCKQGYIRKHNHEIEIFLQHEVDKIASAK